MHEMPGIGKFACVLCLGKWICIESVLTLWLDVASCGVDGMYDSTVMMRCEFEILRECMFASPSAESVANRSMHGMSYTNISTHMSKEALCLPVTYI